MQFHLSLLRDWGAGISEAEEDDDVKVIVFKGAGRAFSAGMDLSRVGFVYGMKAPKSGEKSGKTPQRAKLKFDRYLFLDFHRKILFCQKLTVAQLQGYCLGVAFQLMLHCDLLIATPTARSVTWRRGWDGGHDDLAHHDSAVRPDTGYGPVSHGQMITGEEAAEYTLVNRAVRPQRSMTKSGPG